MRTGTLKSLTVIVALLGACSGCGTSGGATATLIRSRVRSLTKGSHWPRVRSCSSPEDTGKRATGKLQADGTFVLSTYKEGDGAVAGEHAVTISGVDKTLAQDRTFKKYMFRSYKALTAEVTPDKTEFTFDLK